MFPNNIHFKYSPPALPTGNATTIFKESLGKERRGARSQNTDSEKSEVHKKKNKQETSFPALTEILNSLQTQ